MRSLLSFFGWLFGVGALLWLYILLSKSQYTSAVPCNITASTVTVQGRVTWNAHYTYAYEGAEFVGDQESQENPYERSERFPEGLNVFYVDPDHPALSRLGAESYSPFTTAYFTIFLILVAVWSWRTVSPRLMM